MRKRGISTITCKTISSRHVQLLNVQCSSLLHTDMPAVYLNERKFHKPVYYGGLPKGWLFFI